VQAVLDLEPEERRSRHARQAVGAAGHLLPLHGDQHHDQADAERGQREIVLLQLQHRHADDQREQRRKQAGQREGHQEPELVGHAQHAGHIAAEAEEGGLRERDRSGVPEDVLEADHQEGKAAADREDAEIVRAREDQPIDGKRQRAGDQRQADAAGEPARRARRGAFRPRRAGRAALRHGAGCAHR
jgi:hypothetical protein